MFEHQNKLSYFYKKQCTMLKNYFLAFLFTLSLTSFAQLTINSSDLPNGGEHILTSVAVLTSEDPTLTGPGYTWDFTSLTPSLQRYEIFDAAGTYTGYYNALYSPFTGVPTTYGKVNFTASLLPIPGMTVTMAYDFFKKSSTSLKQVGLAYTLNDSLPLPFEYTQADYVYNFPVNYGNVDSCNFKYSPHHIIPAGTLPFYYGGTGKRINEVDGWGTLTTPYGSYPTLRIKSTVTQTDTVFLDSVTGGIALPRPVKIEYKWLTPGAKVPLLQIDANILFGASQITSIIYIDSLRSEVPYIGINEISASSEFTVFPNPATEVINVQYTMAVSGKAGINIYNSLGQLISVVADGVFLTGKQTISLNTKALGLKAGVYFISFESGKTREVKKVVVGE
jgi:hypothetical protein